MNTKFQKRADQLATLRPTHETKFKRPEHEMIDYWITEHRWKNTNNYKRRNGNRNKPNIRPLANDSNI